MSRLVEFADKDVAVVVGLAVGEELVRSVKVVVAAVGAEVLKVSNMPELVEVDVAVVVVVWVMTLAVGAEVVAGRTGEVEMEGAVVVVAVAVEVVVGAVGVEM